MYSTPLDSALYTVLYVSLDSYRISTDVPDASQSADAKCRRQTFHPFNRLVMIQLLLYRLDRKFLALMPKNLSDTTVCLALWPDAAAATLTPRSTDATTTKDSPYPPAHLTANENNTDIVWVAGGEGKRNYRLHERA